MSPKRLREPRMAWRKTVFILLAYLLCGVGFNIVQMMRAHCNLCYADIVKKSRDLLWILLVIVAAAAVATVLKSPYNVVPSLPGGIKLGINGICVADTRAQVARVLGQPAREAGDQGNLELYYGLKDPTAWFEGCDTQVTVGAQGTVTSIYGTLLTDSTGIADIAMWGT